MLRISRCTDRHECRCILSVWDQSCQLSVGQAFNRRMRMSASHAQISYSHRPYVMERKQNGGSESTVFDREFMLCEGDNLA